LRRRNLILLGAPVGAVAGFSVWLAAGGASADADRLAPLQQQATRLRPPPPHSDAALVTDITDLLATPIFALTTGVGAVKESALRLDGVSISRRRTAALLSIDGQPAEWWSVGDSRDGFTLQQVRASRVSLETPLGVREVVLGVSAGAPPADPGAAPPAVVDQPPPGFRAPPPPASAPRVQR